MNSVLTDPPTHTIEGDELDIDNKLQREEDEEPKSNKLITAYVENPCYICQTYLSSPSALRNHMNTAHNIILPPRVASKNRPRSVKYQFVTKKSQFHRRTLFGCPSCWFHCKQDFQRIETHITENHLDEDGPGFENPEDEEGDISDEEEDGVSKGSFSTASYMVAQLDELSAKFKTLLGFS